MCHIDHFLPLSGTDHTDEDTLLMTEEVLRKTDLQLLK
jgi:hypothetical protein